METEQVRTKRYTPYEKRHIRQQRGRQRRESEHREEESTSLGLSLGILKSGFSSLLDSFNRWKRKDEEKTKLTPKKLRYRPQPRQHNLNHQMIPAEDQFKNSQAFRGGNNGASQNQVEWKTGKEQVKPIYLPNTKEVNYPRTNNGRLRGRPGEVRSQPVLTEWDPNNPISIIRACQQALAQQSHGESVDNMAGRILDQGRQPMEDGPLLGLGAGALGTKRKRSMDADMRDAGADEADSMNVEQNGSLTEVNSSYSSRGGDSATGFDKAVEQPRHKMARHRYTDHPSHLERPPSGRNVLPTKPARKQQRRARIPAVQVVRKPIVDLSKLPPEKLKQPGYVSADFDLSDEEDEKNHQEELAQQAKHRQAALLGQQKPLLSWSPGPGTQNLKGSPLTPKPKQLDEKIFQRRIDLEKKDQKLPASNFTVESPKAGSPPLLESKGLQFDQIKPKSLERLSFMPSEKTEVQPSISPPPMLGSSGPVKKAESAKLSFDFAKPAPPSLFAMPAIAKSDESKATGNELKGFGAITSAADSKTPAFSSTITGAKADTGEQKSNGFNFNLGAAESRSEETRSTPLFAAVAKPTAEAPKTTPLFASTPGQTTEKTITPSLFGVTSKPEAAESKTAPLFGAVIKPSADAAKTATEPEKSDQEETAKTGFSFGATEAPAPAKPVFQFGPPKPAGSGFQFGAKTFGESTNPTFAAGTAAGTTSSTEPAKPLFSTDFKTNGILSDKTETVTDEKAPAPLFGNFMNGTSKSTAIFGSLKQDEATPKTDEEKGNAISPFSVTAAAGAFGKADEKQDKKESDGGKTELAGKENTPIRFTPFTAQQDNETKKAGQKPSSLFSSTIEKQKLPISATTAPPTALFQSSTAKTPESPAPFTFGANAQKKDTAGAAGFTFGANTMAFPKAGNDKPATASFGGAFQSAGTASAGTAGGFSFTAPSGGFKGFGANMGANSFPDGAMKRDKESDMADSDRNKRHHGQTFGGTNEVAFGFGQPQQQPSGFGGSAGSTATTTPFGAPQNPFAAGSAQFSAAAPVFGGSRASTPGISPAPSPVMNGNPFAMSSEGGGAFNMGQLSSAPKGPPGPPGRKILMPKSRKR